MPPDSCIVPASTPIPTLEPAIARLSQSLSNLTTSHLTNVSAMTSAVEELVRIEEKEKELREAIEKIEAQRSWFSVFQEFIEGVAHFLDEKVKCAVWFTDETFTQCPVSRSGETRGRTSLLTQRKIRYRCGAQKSRRRGRPVLIPGQHSPTCVRTAQNLAAGTLSCTFDPEQAPTSSRCFFSRRGRVLDRLIPVI